MTRQKKAVVLELMRLQSVKVADFRPVGLGLVIRFAVYAACLLRMFATVEAYHLPPRRVGKPKSFNLSAIAGNVSPLFR